MNPVLVNVIRKNQIESWHRGAVVVVKTDGEKVFSLGDVDALTYPRSSLKLFQAIPLITSGAADRFKISKQEIALACASHSAENIHTEAVQKWLDKLDLTEECLECGPDLSMEDVVLRSQLLAGREPDKTCHNCSGKHTGMLTVAKQLGLETQGYSLYEHGVQSEWMKTFSTLIERNVFDFEWERDGCGLPAMRMPLERLAYGYSCFASTKKFEPALEQAMQRILGAIQQHPEMIAGTKRCCTAVIRATQGRVIVKLGAEGVYGGVVPELGIGFAIKIDDGATRASEVALGGLLNRLGVLDTQATETLSPFFQPDILNSQNKKTGYIEASEKFN